MGPLFTPHKPVQHPFLLDAIIEETPDIHPDKECLLNARIKIGIGAAIPAVGLVASATGGAEAILVEQMRTELRDGAMLSLSNSQKTLSTGVNR